MIQQDSTQVCSATKFLLFHGLVHAILLASLHFHTQKAGPLTGQGVHAGLASGPVLSFHTRSCSRTKFLVVGLQDQGEVRKVVGEIARSHKQGRIGLSKRPSEGTQPGTDD